MSDVTVAETPGPVNACPIFVVLFFARWIAMKRDRHNVCRSIRKPDSCSRKRDFHHVAGEITGGVIHDLLIGCNIERSCVVVSSKMSGRTAARSSFDKCRNGTVSPWIKY